MSLVPNEDVMGEDFVNKLLWPGMSVKLNSELFQLGFLSNLVKIFPSLATRPLLLTGESYAGTFIVRNDTKTHRRRFLRTSGSSSRT